MAARSLFWVCVCALVAASMADVYMHSMRGSNNRLNEASRDRNNANRLFDSQNNDRGGYNVGTLPTHYYTASQLTLEWTYQHACHNTIDNCNLVLQYMCDSRLRDGTTTNTIPDNPTSCQDNNCDTDTTFGRHESYDYYQTCKQTSRNKGLFISSQNVGNAAINTRQNPNGARRGYECPEERDYYPYWRPSPWRDIAIITDNTAQCTAYQAASENIVGRWYCAYSTTTTTALANTRGWRAVTKSECTASRTVNGVTFTGTWTQAAALGGSAPACVATNATRDNHNGNTADGFPARYVWTVPSTVTSENCALRLRYNISTGEFSNLGFNTNAAVGPGPIVPYNTSISPATLNGQTGQQSTPLFTSVYNLTRAQALNRQYYLKNNPQVKIVNPTTSAQLTFQLAVNTAQYGRTFQDRSHRFAIRTRPSTIAASANIINMSVRGKRGNIVQVYPAVEYDFMPEIVKLRTSDYLHIQWTGSNNNPANNEGAGTAGTDRSNMVTMRARVYDEGQPAANLYPLTIGQLGAAFPGNISSQPFLGLTWTQLNSLAVDGINNAYYNLAPQQVTKTGTYHVVSTRNNNFSNRSQKAQIIVSDTITSSTNNVAWGPTLMTVGKHSLDIREGTFTQEVQVTLENQIQKSEFDSEFVNLILPTNKPAQHMKLSIDYQPRLLHAPTVYKQIVDMHGNVLSYQPMSSEVDGSSVSADVHESGVYVVKNSPSWTMISVGSVALIAAIAGARTLRKTASV